MLGRFLARSNGSSVTADGQISWSTRKLRPPFERGRPMVAESTLHPTLLCRAHLHHKWVTAVSEDGGRHMRCAHCGKDKTEVDLENLDNKKFGGGLAGMGGGA